MPSPETAPEITFATAMVRHINNQVPAIYEDDYEPGSYDEEAGSTLWEAVDKAADAQPEATWQQTKLQKRASRLEHSVFVGQGGSHWVLWWEAYGYSVAAPAEGLTRNGSYQSVANDSRAGSVTRPGRITLPSLVNITQGDEDQAHAQPLWGETPVVIS